MEQSAKMKKLIKTLKRMKHLAAKGSTDAKLADEALAELKEAEFCEHKRLEHPSPRGIYCFRFRGKIGC